MILELSLLLGFLFQDCHDELGLKYHKNMSLIKSLRRALTSSTIIL